MTIKTWTLTRDVFTDVSTSGILSTGEVSCFTLEPARPIPEGAYRCSMYNSPRLMREVILLHDVPGYSMIEIHPGNSANDTEGCILLGGLRGVDCVFLSVAAFDHVRGWAKHAIDHGELMITIGSNQKAITC